MKKQLFFLVLLCTSFLYAQKDVNVPDVTSFDTGVGSESSVNQSNGKLGISLNLVSLEGYKDLNASFGISYDGNNVDKAAKASNEHRPTGVLGLGWGINFSRIFADNKLTANRDDDTYYMFDSAALIPLIATETTTTRITFKSKTVRNWKIYFYPNNEKWEVVRDNGYTYTYDNVDWAVYWENWVGNSNRSGANRQGASWNLTEIKDLFGNAVSYEYDNVNQSLSNTGGVQHTEATYLRKIIGPLGEEIELIYGTKTSQEYYEQNTASVEPDAYQELYEKKFLNLVRARDSNGSLLYTYDFNYRYIGGSSVYRKRLLDEILLTNATGEVQTFREFQYDENASSDTFGMLLHQILPTKGRVSYQYAVNEIEIDQVFNINSSDNTHFIIQKDYILRFVGGQVFLLMWNGHTWEQELFYEMPGLVEFDEDNLNLHVVAKENFFAILHPDSPTDILFLAGLQDNGKTWSTFPFPFHDVGVDYFISLRLMSGDDFVAVGNPQTDRINFFKWDGNSWDSFSHYDNSTTGDFYYTSGDNYVLQHYRNASPDRIKLFYYDVMGEVQVKDYSNFANLNADGSSNPTSYWYGSNSFAYVNANANPEYVFRWDKNYNFLSRDNTPFGALEDDILTYGIYNNYFSAVRDRIISGSDNNDGLTKTIRYRGGGQWSYFQHIGGRLIDDENPSGFGDDIFVASNSGGTSNQFRVFNANTGSWLSSSFSSGISSTNNRMSFDVFARRYAFANRTLYRINKNLSVSSVATFPTNTLFSRSDGQNLLYISSRNGDRALGSAFAKILSITDGGTIFEENLPNGYFLKQNKYKNFPSHAMGYGTFILEDNNGNAKIYRMYNDRLDYDTSGKTVYKDVVIVKETFDPVLSRKQRNYYCYSDPVPSVDNMRTYYKYVCQSNDLDNILGKSITSYDIGLEDNRMIGLPKVVRIYDGNNKLISQQENFWQIRQLGEYYYINQSHTINSSFEGNTELQTRQDFTYDLVTGLLQETATTDSDGNQIESYSRYVFEEYPEALDYNIISPIAFTRTRLIKPDNTSIYTASTAVEWDFNGIPTPKTGYTWNGTGTTVPNFDFSNPSANTDFRFQQRVDRIDEYGNVIEETNRTEVTSAYIYGYGGKRLVASVEGATYDEAMDLLISVVIDNPTSDEVLRDQIQYLRDNIDDAFVTGYTYNPSVGLTSQTDIRGRKQTYTYDDFYRLDHVKDNDGYILSKTYYDYREAPFTYSAESTDIQECSFEDVTTDGDPDHTPPDPPSLVLTVFSQTSNSITYKVTPSGANFEYFWNTSFIEGDQSDFVIQNLGVDNDKVKITNPNCNYAYISVSVIGNYTDADGNNQTTVSNIRNHTFSSDPLECNPQ